MSEARIIKPCPFCGKVPEIGRDQLGEFVHHKTDWCPIGGPFRMDPEVWNRRESETQRDPILTVRGHTFYSE